jgi:hypothetical protein
MTRHTVGYGTGRGIPRPVPTVVLLVGAQLAVLASSAVLASPAWASPAGDSVRPDRPVAVVVFVWALMLAATAAAAGLAMLRPVTGAPGDRRRFTAVVAAVTSAAAQLMAIDVSPVPPAALVVSALVTLTLPVLLSRPRAALAAGTLVAAAVSTFAGITRAGSGNLAGHLAVALPLGIAATVCAGVAVSVATGAVGARGAVARRLTPYLFTSVGVLAIVGAVQAIAAGVPPDDRIGSLYGVLVLVRALAVLGCVVGLVVALRSPELTRLRAGAWAATIATTAILSGAALPAEPAPSGVPVLADVTVGGHRVPVLVAPARPGWNLVHVGVDAVSVGTDPARLTGATARKGTGLGWAEVWLPAGRSRLWIGHGGAVAALTVDAGKAAGGTPDLRGPDGPECASTALGRLLAGATAPLHACPADRLTAADAGALRAMVRFLAGRGVKTATVVGDSSARATAAATTLRDEAARAGVALVGPGARTPLLLVSGWDRADSVIADVSAGRLPAEGTYLAPWLLNTPLLAPPAGQLLPLRFDPAGASAQAYLAALNARFPGEPATDASYAGWPTASERDTGTPRIYAASTLIVPGVIAAVGGISGVGGGGHAGHNGRSDGRWLPNGTVLAVSGPLDLA